MHIPNTLQVKFFLKYAFKNHNDKAKILINTHTHALPQNINPSEVKTFKWRCRKDEEEVKRTEYVPYTII